ncbi:MAG: efflux RND transporter permease subunit, partial [Planctomycetes bacterium]|nr:efflux RND transporter permease subunit [Planctomycetota bacterium]
MTAGGYLAWPAGAVWPAGILAALVLAAGGGGSAAVRPDVAAPHDLIAQGRAGVVVSAEPHATRVGLRVLADGGNAVDAAVAVALTLAAFPLIGESLNLMSLGGLAVAIGLIIDDAIVVVENVGRRLQLAGTSPDGPGLFACVSDGTGEVFGAVVGSSLTTVVVFVPLVLLEGVVGQFFRSLSVALGASVLASMIVSLVYTPLALLLPGMAPRRGRPPRRWMTRLQDLYVRVVRATLAR